MVRGWLAAIAVACAVPCVAQDRVPVESLSSVPEQERTEVMILATGHYAGVEGVTPAHFDDVIAHLKVFDPQIVAVERIPAHEIALFLQTPRYAASINTYVGRFLPLLTIGQAASGLDPVEAAVAMGEWSNGPASLDDEARLERMHVALSAYELETALTYYRALSDEARQNWRGSVSDDAQERIDELDGSTNERVAVAARLAQELDLPRVWNVDSHLEDPAFRDLVPELLAGLEPLGGPGAIAAEQPFATAQAIQQSSIAQGSLVPVYDFLNSAQYGVDDVRAQIDVFNRLDLPDGIGKVRQALWDERNYRIAANIRRAMAAQPGKRVLLIIGAGHKPWLDQILSATLDMRLVQWADMATD